MNQATIDISKYQGKVLEAIMATKRLEVAKAQSQIPVADLKDLARSSEDSPRFRRSFDS